ncbi:hypothetical protein EV714DRAFT_238441 [Schizophyllum commune]
MVLLPCSSNLPPQPHSKVGRHGTEFGRHHSTAKPLASTITEDYQPGATQPSSSTATESSSQRPSFTASSHRVPLIIPHEIEWLPAYVCTCPRLPISPSPARTLPPAISPAPPRNYFDPVTHHIHLPYPIVAICKVDEEAHTVYFTRADQVLANVVYASVWRHATLGVDLFFLPSMNNPRPFTQKAIEVANALARVVGRFYKHVHRQHLFMQYARCFSRDLSMYPCRARIRYPDAKPTTLIPGVPYFEYFLERIATPREWGCEEIAKIFDPPELELRLLA